jgi:hypothetical protein
MMVQGHETSAWTQEIGREKQRTEKGDDAICRWLRPGIVFQTEIYAILLCAYENIRRAYKHKRILIFSDSQAAL